MDLFLGNLDQQMHRPKSWLIGVGVLFGLSFAHCASSEVVVVPFALEELELTPYAVSEQRASCSRYQSLRQPFFGNLDLETLHSRDKKKAKNARPVEAYELVGSYAKVEPSINDQGQYVTSQSERPLDFAAVTDSAEFLGEMNICASPGVKGYWHPACVLTRHFPDLNTRVFGFLNSLSSHRWGFCGEERHHCSQSAAEVWQKMGDAAESVYDRSDDCAFTSFLGYDWTGGGDDTDDGTDDGTDDRTVELNRKVIFKNTDVPPRPISGLDAPLSADLWKALKHECIDGRSDCDAITISYDEDSSLGLGAENRFNHQDGLLRRAVTLEEGRLSFPADPEFGDGALTVLWAEENTRDSLFAAMQRQEAYKTSGTRPIVRMFAGWDLPETLCSAPDRIAQAYRLGVPMGGDIRRMPNDESQLRIMVAASMDQGIAELPGTPLQQLQIIKRWYSEGILQEKVVDLVGVSNKSSLNQNACNKEIVEREHLCAVWEDEDFNALQNTFYYVRVLEGPSCPLSTQACVSKAIDCEAGVSGACCDESSRSAIQHRAWSSPVWYSAPSS